MALTRYTGVAVSLVLAVAACGGDDAAPVDRQPQSSTSSTTAPVAGPAIGDSWTTLPPGPADGRTFPIAVWTGTELVVWGGETTSETEWADDGAAYDPAAGTWRRLAPSPLSARSEHVATWTGDEVIVCCGRAADGRRERAAAAYDPARDRWRELAPPPFAAAFAVGAWTGDAMIVTGGVTDGGVGQADGTWAYEPGTDTWTERAPAPAVIERQAEAAWTGDRLIVYPRTFTDAPPLVYDPAADEWTVLPGLPDDLAIDNGSMVWTGEEIIAWGVGEYPSDTDAVGARLSLDDRRWRPLADDPLPPVDWFEGTPGSNSAVWTGDEMIVWTGAVGPGGPEGPTTVLAYDPASDRWRELDGAPSGGYHPTLVWTGDVVLALTGRPLALDP